jgi:hypothetical protein
MIVHDWIDDVCYTYRQGDDIKFMAIDLYDRYTDTVAHMGGPLRNVKQTLAGAALIIAAKFWGTDKGKRTLDCEFVRSLMCYSVKRSRLVDAERQILVALDFRLMARTTYTVGVDIGCAVWANHFQTEIANCHIAAAERWPFRFPHASTTAIAAHILARHQLGIRPSCTPEMLAAAGVTHPPSNGYLTEMFTRASHRAVFVDRRWNPIVDRFPADGDFTGEYAAPWITCDN